MLAIGIMGGSFDPVHRAHIQLATSVLESLQLDEVRLVPCQQSPTRSAPVASAEHRLAMLQRAIVGLPGLKVDDLELHRPAPSYTVDSLREFRRRYPQAALFFIVGTDAFNGLAGWHEWQELFKLAHIVVVARPGEQLATTGPIADVMAKRGTDNKPTGLAGAVVTGLYCELPHSSTEVRQQLRQPETLENVLEASVIEYIEENGLYQ